MKRFILVFASLSLFILIAAQPPVLARNGSGIPLNPKPFHLPFLDPPGPGTWLLGQPYGNTTGAYRQRKTTYGQGQGIHFGIDLLAACKTPALALADGTVVGVDGLFGSAPHNLMILFPNGYATMYGQSPVGLPDTYSVNNPLLVSQIQDVVWDVVSTHPYAGVAVPEPTLLLVPAAALMMLNRRQRKIA